jgi:hypothetical protein
LTPRRTSDSSLELSQLWSSSSQAPWVHWTAVSELLLGLIVVGIAVAFVADRRGGGAVEVMAVVALLALDVFLMITTLRVALVQDCEGSGCNNGLLLALVVAVAGTTFAIGFLLMRAMGRR